MTTSRNLSHLAPGTNTSGVVQPSNGGTGLTSSGANGNLLVSNGTTWQSTNPNYATTGKAIAMTIVFGG